MREIKYPKIEPEPKEIVEGAQCNCGGRLYHSAIPCPEGKAGCCVCHYGYRCFECGKIYQ